MTNNFFDYAEDKSIQVNDDWFFHAMNGDINILKQILCDGLKSAYLRKKQSNGGYNGRYYVSVSKKSNNPQSVYRIFEHLPILVLSDINPIKADNKNKNYQFFMETFLPFRTSGKADEYQAFLRIKPSKIVAIGFNLYYLLSDNYISNIKQLQTLKELVMLLEEMNQKLPIYDFSLNREINKKRIKSLSLEEMSKLII